MNHHRWSRRRATGVALTTTASLALAALAGTSYASGGSTPPAATTRAGASPQARLTAARQAARTAAGYVDVSEQGPAIRADTPKPNANGLVLDMNSSTGTVRWTGKLNGFLTPASTDAPKKIVLDYIKNHSELGITGPDLDTLHLHRDYKDITGTHHLYFQQKIGGTVVARNGLTASVNRNGHLLTVGGSPHSTSARTAVTTQQRTITTAAQALARTRGPAVAGADLGGDTAKRVLFDTGTALRPAWDTVVLSSAQPADTVVDAVTGKVLLRRPLTSYEHSTGRVFTYFPGAKRGGHQVKVDFTKRHWLKANARRLKGNNSHTFSDVNDNDRAGRREEVHPQKGSAWSYRLKAFHLPFATSFCSNPWPCSWNPNKAFSWRVNRAQNATQVFFFVNKWHDHLRAAPIGFTEAAGNFQLKNHSTKGKAGDPVATQTDDGANTGLRGLPDDFHIDNAFMITPPDGRSPTMAMFLQHAPHTSYSVNGDPFSPTNVGDEADTVYHEYTHGLSGRLNVDVQGHSTLGGVQAGAMGEGWSDWYAMDFLVRKHLAHDGRKKADVRLFPYDGKGVRFDRTEPIDCKVGQTSARLCNGGSTPHRGGYTYQDYGKVVGFPEVHGDGEIWAQTLWSLRARLGSAKSESLVTRAMELAPYNPSFLDMRNAIMVADQSRNRGADEDVIWKVFAGRGMGFSASSDGGGDTSPIARFDAPPFPVTTRSAHRTSGAR